MKIELNKWKKLAMALSLIIILNVFFNVTIDTFYKMPDWVSSCPDKLNSVSYEDKKTCEEVGGMWTENMGYPKEAGVTGYCNAQYTCQKEYEAATSVYNRNVFVVLTALGALTIIAALFAALPSSVSSGLLYGGILSLIIGTIRFWSDMDDYIRFIVTGVVLILLITIGVKKMKD